MLRYFVAGHVWLFFLLALLFGSGYARHSPSSYQCVRCRLHRSDALQFPGPVHPRGHGVLHEGLVEDPG